MRIRTRIILSSILSVLLVNVASTYYFTTREREVALSRLRTTIGETELLLKSVIAGPLYDGSVDQLNSDIDSFFLNEDIVEIELVEMGGGIRIERQRPAPGDGGELITSVGEILGGTATHFKWSSDPADSQPPLDTLGEVRVVYSTALIEQRLNESRNQLVGFSAILLLVLSVVIYLVAKGLTGPIDRL